MKTFEMIKKSVKTATNEMLKGMYEELLHSEFTVPEMLVMTAIEIESEKRGIMVFNEETEEYEFVK